MESVLALIAVLVVLNIMLTGSLMGFLFGREHFHRSEEHVQAAMDEHAADELRRGKEMDEGFDNLMRFSVNGQDGFGGGGP